VSPAYSGEVEGGSFRQDMQCALESVLHSVRLCARIGSGTGTGTRHGNRVRVGVGMGTGHVSMSRNPVPTRHYGFSVFEPFGLIVTTVKQFTDSLMY
jgi:hypothetical protein